MECNSKLSFTATISVTLVRNLVVQNPQTLPTVTSRFLFFLIFPLLTLNWL